METLYIGELSANRAFEIKKALVLKGIDPDRIFTFGEGSKKANITKEDYARIKHNRVAYFQAISNNQFDIKILESGEYLQGLFFTIQIRAFKKIIVNNRFSKYGKVLIASGTDGYVKYSVDIFQN